MRRRHSGLPASSHSDDTTFEYIPVDWTRADEEVRQSMMEVAARYGFHPRIGPQPVAKPWHTCQAAPQKVSVTAHTARSVASSAVHREKIKNIDGEVQSSSGSLSTSVRTPSCLDVPQSRWLWHRAMGHQPHRMARHVELMILDESLAMLSCQDPESENHRQLAVREGAAAAAADHASSAAQGLLERLHGLFDPQCVAREGSRDLLSPRKDLAGPSVWPGRGGGTVYHQDYAPLLKGITQNAARKSIVEKVRLLRSNPGQRRQLATTLRAQQLKASTHRPKLTWPSSPLMETVHLEVGSRSLIALLAQQSVGIHDRPTAEARKRAILWHLFVAFASRAGLLLEVGFEGGVGPNLRFIPSTAEDSWLEDWEAP
eukprot:GGOE01020546.1.p1 GENE.GGOE01020546.1~~GGOE01020546.1.p1  ORF type:complete len:372 (+),score=60.06 GGOE01020546.1:148-1263(+)